MTSRTGSGSAATASAASGSTKPQLTLLPRADFARTAQILELSDLLASLEACDYLLKRFAKGRIPTQPWAVMWDAYRGALATLGSYYAADYWQRRAGGGRSFGKTHARELYEKMESFRRTFHPRGRPVTLPDWFGLPEFHNSHVKFLETRDYGDLWWPYQDEEEF